MTAEQNQTTTGLEGITVRILPSVVAEVLTATERCRFLQVLVRQFIHIFRLIVTVVKQNRCLAVMADIEMLPVRNSFIGLETAVVGVDTRRDVVLDPPLRSVLFAIRHEPHSRFHAMREQFGDVGLRCELNTTGQRFCLSHLREILLHGHVRTEMQEVLQFIAVDIPHAVEITGGEPIGIEDLLGFGTTDAVEQQALELVVRQAVFRTGTDVIVVTPELSRYVRTANALEQSSAIFHRSPLQHATNRHMEHDRVVVLEDRRIEDT